MIRITPYAIRVPDGSQTSCRYISKPFEKSFMDTIKLDTCRYGMRLRDNPVMRNGYRFLFTLLRIWRIPPKNPLDPKEKLKSKPLVWPSRVKYVFL